MLSTCVKHVNSVGVHSQKPVSIRPQLAIPGSINSRTNVYKPPKFPTIRPFLSQLFPHHFSRIFYLLQPLFSPLSTPPITTRAN